MRQSTLGAFQLSKKIAEIGPQWRRKGPGAFDRQPFLFPG
jgi:hypothetical protein